MRKSAAKHNQRKPGRRRAFSELATTLGVLTLLAAAGYWFLDSHSLRMARVELNMTSGLPVSVLGETFCRPSCRASQKRCAVSTGGFSYQQTRCQETLKQCLIRCEGQSMRNLI